MNKFCKWLIEKLGGVPKEDWCLFHSDYWKEECVRMSVYVAKEHFNDATKPDIERELARKLGEELLERDLLMFDRFLKPDIHGDIQIHCQANVLRLKERTSMHMPPHLKKGDDTMNESTKQ